MNLLQGGSGTNEQIDQPAVPETPVADAMPAQVEPSAAPAPAQPEPLVSQPLAMAASEPEPPAAQPIPEPRPAPPPNAPKRRGPAIVAILIALLLLAGAGVGGWWFFTQRNSTSETPPAQVMVKAEAPGELEQVTAAGTSINAGKSTNQTTLQFRFTVSTIANQGELTPEVEVRPVGTAFTGEPTLTGQAVSADGRDMKFSVSSETLTQGAYHWQARVSKGDERSDWVVFGTDAAATAFSIDTAAPAQPVVSTVAGKKLTNPVVVTSNQPVFSGTAEPDSSIQITIGEIKLEGTADAKGAWSITPTATIPNGQHDVSVVATDQAGNSSQEVKLALSVNPATAADAAPKPSANPSPSPAASPEPAPAPVPQTPTKLAATGDYTGFVSLMCLVALMTIGAGWLVIRRRYAAD